MISYFFRVIFIGIGATLIFDLWGLLLKGAFKVPPSNMCLVGRWILYMPEGTIRHANIALIPPKRAECAVGWITHYMIGIAFAIVFVVVVGTGWFQWPTVLPAILFGVVTVLAPFLIMQPMLGLGIAASNTSNPVQARIRSLMNHTAFGIGLYLFGWIAHWLSGI